MKKSIFLLITLLAFCGSAFADGDEPETTESQYITPNNMSNDDRQMLSDYSGSYYQCLSDSSMQQVQTQNDPRRIVDIAMKSCAIHLETLQQKMNERNFDPNFIDYYLHHTSTNGANNALRTMMMVMATKQQNAEPAPEK